MNIEKVELTQDLDKRAALVSVRVGEIVIHGVVVWRGGNGRLRVFFPEHRQTYGYVPTIEMPPELRSEIEAAVIAEYKATKSVAAAREKQTTQGGR